MERLPGPENGQESDSTDGITSPPSVGNLRVKKDPPPISICKRKVSQNCHAAAERAEVMLEGPEIESSHCSSAAARSVHPGAEEALAPELRAERRRGHRGRDGQALPRSQEEKQGGRGFRPDISKIFLTVRVPV